METKIRSWDARTLLFMSIYGHFLRYKNVLDCAHVRRDSANEIMRSFFTCRRQMPNQPLELNRVHRAALIDMVKQIYILPERLGNTPGLARQNIHERGTLSYLGKARFVQCPQQVDYFFSLTFLFDTTQAPRSFLTKAFE